MSIRNPKREELRRLESKTLDAQFKTAVQEGLNCSPFEAEAVLGVVREVYFPFMEPSAGTVPPGKVTLVAVCADEPAGKPVSDCEKRSVCLTVHRGVEDDRLMQTGGPAAYRQARIVDLCQEAMSQGALLTRENLAYRVFFVNVRTISRDLDVLRRSQPEVRLVPSGCGLPRNSGGSASALPFSRPAQRSLALRPARSPSRPRRPSTPKASTDLSPPRLLRLLPAGATSCRVGISPTEDPSLSTAH